jgi:hypothetical protein
MTQHILRGWTRDAQGGLRSVPSKGVGTRAGAGVWRTRPVLVFGLPLLLLASGCSFGPKVLERTHGRYYESVRQVDEEELLRNLVHLRYNEFPMALNVSSIAAQYELTGSAEARPFFGTPNPAGDKFRTFPMILPDFMVEGANRPTITLLPGNDPEATREFLTPSPPRPWRSSTRPAGRCPPSCGCG